MPLFINPSIHTKSQRSFITKHMVSQAPMGIGYIAGYLRDKVSAHIRVVDEGICSLTAETLRDELERLDSPKIVGISSKTIQIGRAYELSRMVKEIDPEVMVVFGGVHSTALPDEVLEHYSVDIVVRNEGEDTFLSLYNALKTGNDYKNITGISYRDLKGKIQHNVNGAILDLSDMPLFPYDLFEDQREHYNRFGSLATSRGCPANCIFCSNRTITGSKYRRFSIDYIEGCLELLIHKYQQEYIVFWDDVLFVNKNHFFELVDLLVRKGYNKRAKFHASVRADSITPEIVKQCKKANFAYFDIGVETSSARLMKVLNKHEKVAQIRKAQDLITGQGIATEGVFIYGIPTETREERKQTLRDALKMPIESARFNVIVPYPGTQMYALAKREGRLNIQEDYYNFNVQYYLFGNELPYVPEGTNRYELILDTMWANIRFYLRRKKLKDLKDNAKVSGGVIHIPEFLGFGVYYAMLKFGVLVTIRFVSVGFMAQLYKAKKYFKGHERS